MNIARQRAAVPPITSIDYLSRKVFSDFVRSHRAELGGVVLDYGSGNSPYRALLEAEAYITADVPGTETAPDYMIDPESDFLCIPEDAYFDSILLVNVIEHVEDYLDVLIRLRARVRPGGHILIKAPFMYPVHEYPNDFTRFTYERMIGIGSGLGSVVDSGVAGNVMCLIFLLLRCQWLPHIPFPLRSIYVALESLLVVAANILLNQPSRYCYTTSFVLIRVD